MANKKAEIKSKNRTLYLYEDLFNKFSEIAKENKKSASSVLNEYMNKVVAEDNRRKKTIFDQE